MILFKIGLFILTAAMASSMAAAEDKVSLDSRVRFIKVKKFEILPQKADERHAKQPRPRDFLKDAEGVIITPPEDPINAGLATQ